MSFLASILKLLNLFVGDFSKCVNLEMAQSLELCAWPYYKGMDGLDGLNGWMNGWINGVDGWKDGYIDKLE